MDLKECIPKHKGDHAVIDRLKGLSIDEIKPILPELLTWIQDIHWPVAKDVAQVLYPHASDITKELIVILRSDDGEWKYNVLRLFGYDSQDPLLHHEISRIAERPAQDEKAYEVDKLARHILEEKVK